MKYFAPNPEIENVIKDIQRKIRLSMNGVAADDMKEKGLIYRKNYGVNLLRLREIVTRYSKNTDVAQRLWALKIRETMILAILLQPENELTEKMANEWLQNVNNVELAEQICMNLLSKVDYAKWLSFNCIQSESVWKNIVGFMLALRIREKLNEEEIKIITNRAVELSLTEEFTLYKSIANCLSRFLRNGEKETILIKERIKTFETGSLSQKYIYEEVMNELSFL